MIYKIILLALFLFAGFLNLPAQTDSVLKYQNALLLMHRTDSIQKLLLQRQLEDLAKNEISKRKKLEKQIAELNKKDSLSKAAMRKEIDSLRMAAKSYPVAPYRDTILHIYTKIGKIAPNERAQIITARLKSLYKEFVLKTDTLGIVDSGQIVDVVFKDRIIISVTDYDALWVGKSKYKIAHECRDTIYRDIEAYKNNTTVLLSQIGLALLVIVLSGILMRLVHLLFKRKVNALIENQKGKKIRGITIRNYQFLDEEKATNVLLFVSRLVRLFLYFILIYVSLLILFSIFPLTQRLAETLFGYILSPAKKIGLSVINYLPSLFTIIVIVLIIRYIIKFLKYITSEIENENLKIPGFYPDWAQPTFNIIRFLVYVFMFIVIFPYLPGSSSPVFQGVSVFVGIVFSLGSSSVISNMVAGLIMTYMRPFQLGDRIKVGEIVGDVVEKTPFVTRIKTPKNEFVTVPNSNILSSNVVNYNTSKQHQGIILHTTVTFGYEIPWKDMHQALIDAALRTEFVLKEPAPFVLQTSLDDFYVSYQLNVYSMEPNRQAGIYSQLHQNIQDVCNERGYELLSPHYRAQRDGNTVAMPPEYLPDNYKAPAFRVKNVTGRTKNNGKSKKTNL